MVRQSFRNVISHEFAAGCALFPENSSREAERAACGERPLEAVEWRLKGGCAPLFEGNMHSQPVNFCKNILRNGVQKILGKLVKIKLKRTHPTIIGITGSFGKTSTKEAVYEVLKTRWRVYRNPKSLNTEIGLLLAILEQSSGFSSPIKWARILTRASWNAFRGAKYDFLVLEYGADKPSDIEHLASIVKPHIGIITHIAHAHHAEGQFKTVEEIFEEKSKLVKCLGGKDVAILNAEDEFLKKLDGKISAKIFWFNSEKGMYADRVTNTHTGFSADIHMNGKKTHGQFTVPGTYHINIMLPALTVGVLHSITLEEGVKALEKFQLPPGRMSLIPGRKGIVLLDSSYNASPETMKEAIALLRDFPGKRKIAVLGTMNELGSYSKELHREIADYMAGADWLDMLITVGEGAHTIAEQALKNGFPKTKIKTLFTAEEAGIFLQNLLDSDKIGAADVILFKGSQNLVRLERAVKMLMKNPQDAKTLLCRQEPEWERIE